MKLLEVPMVVTSLFGFCFLSGLDAPPAHANFTFGTPTNLGPAINTSAWEGGVCISPDGLELYLYSFTDGWAIPTFRVSKRATTDDPWEEAVSLTAPFKRITASCISADGLSLYFEPQIQSGDTDIWMATRASVSEPWANPVNLGPLVNSTYLEMGPSITADGLELYFQSIRPGGWGDWDIWISKRARVSDPWGKAVNLGPTVNSPAYDVCPFVTPDGLVLFITSTRPGGYGDTDIWMSRRATRDSEWGVPVNLGPSLNTAAGEAEPHISTDGRTLYFDDGFTPRSGGLGQSDLWQAPILPIVDFNGDDKVDLDDLVLLIDNWGTDDTLCDIGPFAWGDGKVDIEDLKVFIAEWEKQNPPAADEGQ